MTKTTLTATACATLLWAGAALATPTPQQQCDATRITAWKTFQSCVEGVVAKDARGVFFDEFAAFARCRHTYFKKWAGFQNPGRRPSLVSSTCIGPRFTDNGDQTVQDNLTGLVWEKKDNLDGSENASDPHDADNGYSWSTLSAPVAESGAVFTGFLGALNGGTGFGGANGWRLPTLAELQTIVLDFVCNGGGLGPHCTCPSSPCVDPALDAANTFPDYTWSATTALPGASTNAWIIAFNNGLVLVNQKTAGGHARAVRGGL